MTFLAGVVSKVLIGLLSGLAGWLVRHTQEVVKDYLAKKAEETASQKAIDDLKNAKTKEELDNAAKGVASDL